MNVVNLILTNSQLHLIMSRRSVARKMATGRSVRSTHLLVTWPI